MSQLSYNSSEEMFKDVREDADEGSLDEAHSILQIDIGESYLAHMVKFSNITATDDSSVPAPDVISLSPLEASCKFWSISSY